MTIEKKHIAVLAGNRIECQEFAQQMGAHCRSHTLETPDALYRFYTQESGADGISADELLTIGSYQKRFSDSFVRITRVACEMYRQRNR